MSTYEIRVDPRELRIDIGMPVHTGFIPFPTATALVDTVRELSKKSLDVRHVCPVGSSIVQDARSGVVDLFLKGDGTHLFWIDSDMHWHPRDFAKLVALGTVFDVVGATYTQKVEPPRYMIRGTPSAPNEYGLVEVLGLGLGFTIMRRAVVERIAATKPMIRTNGGEMREVFEFGRTPEGHRLGEDMRFFQDIRDAGYKVWMDPTLDIGHVGLKVYRGSAQTGLAL